MLQLLTTASNRTVRHATIAPIAAPDKSEAPVEDPEPATVTVFNAAVVSKSSAVVVS
jgi:hypothetical protein